MAYPVLPNMGQMINRLETYAQVAHERGAVGVQAELDAFIRDFERHTQRLAKMPIDPEVALREPDDLQSIRKLRPRGLRRIWKSIPASYLPRLQGALLGRMAGCTLGAAVEAWPFKDVENWAAEHGDAFPPVNYWKAVPFPFKDRYGKSSFREYTRGGMIGVPVDDDIVYTLLGLLIVEQYGPDFTTADVGRAWMQYLPLACTAEEQALNNLKSGIKPEAAADINNPYCEWLGADIRCDPWAYIAPGWPEKAAEFAYRDATLSHRRQGVYGAMFFAAAISAAFTVDDPMEAIRIGLTEIPKQCALASAVKWAIRQSPRVKTYKQAYDAVGNEFRGMSTVHTINNACNVVFGIGIGGRDLTKVIGNIVAMWLDVDCNAATAGSIVGATVGKKGIASHWYRPFKNTIHSYLIGHETFKISDVIRRFQAHAHRIQISSQLS